MFFEKLKILIIIFSVTTINSFSQISPGELSSGHSTLEGISNCTKCHILGEQLSNDKCLECHKELKERILLNKGYHSSYEVKAKQCANCHSDHHGKNFKIIKFDDKKFNHNLTGFSLIGAHSKKICKDCHNPKNIKDLRFKNKKITYLGLKPECNNCHKDYHQNTLSSNCVICHDANAFKPASKFNHSSSKFQLTGKHNSVECIKCHKIELKNNVKYQQFKGLQFNTCTNCHKDVHQNKFGSNCSQCHTTESFLSVKASTNFDHSKTKYTLEGKHLTVNCKLCHKLKYTTPIKHDKCINCHQDYHNGEFVKNNVTPDCASCHNLTGFKNTSYTLEQHNNSNFALNGAHLATPCFDCHKKAEKWKFRNIGKKCADCHKNIHQNFISNKYYPEDNCLSCHNTNKWTDIKFEHNQTNFNLQGVHNNISCRKCHFKANPEGKTIQQFVNLSSNCSSCHNDKHFKQFDINSITDCARCHVYDNWKAIKFNHNTTAFKLEGKHEKVTCNKCHKPVEINNNRYIIYKISIKCESCHT